MDLLGDSESDDNDRPTTESLTINRKYAQSYERWRKKEEHQKLIDKYGEDVDSESSSEEEEEIRSTPQMDKEWLRAYAVVRFNQPRLYTGEHLFQDEVKPAVKKSEKVETLKDYERRFILEKGGVESEDDSDEQRPPAFGKSYFEEQTEIKDSFKAALHDSDSDDDNDRKEKDSLLVKKVKSREQQKKEENEYLEWLKGEREDLEDEQAAEELAPLKAYWNDPNLTEKERVLRDYILNNGYMDKEESEEESESDEGPDVEDEEEFLEKADEYEHTYNFRHEEPGGSEIRSYPRVIETSVRVKDSRRADKRQRRMDKKTEEKKQKQEEIRLLQKLQREEKEEKLRKLRDISENTELRYDLDADFDPDEHNKIMGKYFNNDYYDDGTQRKKPVFEYDEAIDDESDDWWHKRTQTQMQEENAEGDGGEEGSNVAEDDVYGGKFIMDADYDAGVDYKSSKKKKEKKKKGKAAKKKPEFDPSSKSFDEFVDEYLKDKIPTLPFPYREVMPNDFGLSTEEILTAPDRELNAWVSVKKMSMYRPNFEERRDVQDFKSKAQNLTSKYKKMPSLLVEPGDEGTVKKKKKRKKKKKNNDNPDVNESMKGEDEPSLSGAGQSKTLPGAKRKELEGEEDKSTGRGKKRKNEDREEDQIKEITPKKKKTGKLKSSTDNNALPLVAKDKSSLVGKNVDSKSTGNQTGKQKSSGKGTMKKDVNTKKLGNKKRKIQAQNSKAGKLSLAEVSPKKDEQSNKEISQSVKGLSQNKTIQPNSDKKKKKIKKTKFHLDHNSTVSGKGDKVVDKKTRKEDLKKVMSSYRLSKYGIGPTVVKEANQGKKKKRKKKNTQKSS